MWVRRCWWYVSGWSAIGGGWPRRSGRAALPWFTADEAYGDNPGLRDWLDEQDLNYVMAVSCDARFATPTGPRRGGELGPLAPKTGGPGPGGRPGRQSPPPGVPAPPHPPAPAH